MKKWKMGKWENLDADGVREIIKYADPEFAKQIKDQLELWEFEEDPYTYDLELGENYFNFQAIPKAAKQVE